MYPLLPLSLVVSADIDPRTAAHGQSFGAMDPRG